MPNRPRPAAGRLVILAAALCLASCGGGSSDSAVGRFAQSSTGSTALAGTEQLVNTAAATLSAAAEVPATNSAALGSGTIMIDPATGQITVTVTINGTTASAVQVESGSAISAGPPMFSLTESDDGVWSASLTLTPTQLQELMNGSWYFNAYSPAFPAGEIRGQIVPQSGSPSSGSSTGSSSSSSSSSTGGGSMTVGGTAAAVLVASLRGTQETPATPSGATGAGSVVVTGSNHSMLAAVRISGVTASTVTIAAGAPGSAGQVLFTLNEVIPGSGVWSTRAALSDAQLAALQAGNWYFNAASAAFPAGEIRGQILPSAAINDASASSSASANDNGSSSSATGSGGTTSNSSPPNGSSSSGSSSSGSNASSSASSSSSI